MGATTAVKTAERSVPNGPCPLATIAVSSMTGVMGQTERDEGARNRPVRGQIANRSRIERLPRLSCPIIEINAKRETVPAADRPQSFHPPVQRPPSAAKDNQARPGVAAWPPSAPRERL